MKLITGTRIDERRVRGLLVAAVLAGGLVGCTGTPFGSCEIRLVELTMPATWTFQGETVEDEWFNRLAETNLDPSTFHPIADALEDAGAARGRLSWILPAFDANPGFIGIRIQVPVRAGDRIPITGVTPVGGFALSSGRVEGAQVDVRAGDFTGTTAEGEIEVRATAPLRVGVDLTATDEGGRILTVRGVLSFRVFEDRVSCF